MILLALAGNAIGKWWRRVVLALAQPTPHSKHSVPSDYYRFPPF
jgi:hypothetical protein